MTNLQLTLIGQPFPRLPCQADRLPCNSSGDELTVLIVCLISHISTRCRSCERAPTIKTVSWFLELLQGRQSAWHGKRGNGCPTRVSVGSSFLKPP